MLAVLVLVVVAGLSERPLTEEQRQAIEEARKDLRSGDPDRIYEAASRLIRMRHREAVTLLTKVFKEGGEEVRLKIVKALADRSSYLSEAIGGYGALLEAAAVSKQREVLEHLERALVEARRPNSAQVASFLAELAKRAPPAAPLISYVLCKLPLDNWREVGFAIKAAGTLWPSEHAKRILAGVNRALFRNFKTPDEAAAWFEKNKNRSFSEVLGEIRKTVDKMRRLILKHIRDKISLIKRLPEQERKKECLMRLADEEEALEVKEFALRELGRLKAKDAASRIAEFLKSGEEGLRIAAVWALGQVGAREFADRIAALLESESEAERLAVVKALRRLGQAPAASLCEALRKEKSDVVLKALLEAVAYLKPSGAAEVIVGKFFVESGGRLVLRGEGEQARLVARTLAAIVQGGSKPVLKALLALTESKDPAVRYAGCEGLGLFGGDVARARLVVLARKEQESGVRAAAIRAIAHAGKPGPDEMDVFFEALGAKEKEVQEAGLDGLRRAAGVVGNGPLDLATLATAVRRLVKENRYKALVRLMDVPQARLEKMAEEQKRRFGSLLLILGEEHARRKALTKAVEVYRRALKYVGREGEGQARLKIASLLEQQSKFAEAYEELKRAQSVLPPEQSETLFIRRLAIIERIAKEKKDKNTAAALLKECIEHAKRLKLSDSARKRLNDLKKVLLGG